eukprot:GEMP01000676.1.p1 GENE.GEMP01000676.1~~GEMP01000676.1.p1  ORF type:complete len:2003 (+),score=377.26 GEMP01000676.1:43-6009(+)
MLLLIIFLLALVDGWPQLRRRKLQRSCVHSAFVSQPGICVGSLEPSAQYSLCGTAFEWGTELRGHAAAVNPATCRGFNSHGVTGALTENQAQQRCMDELHCAGYLVWKPPHGSAGKIRLVSNIATLLPGGGEHCVQRICAGLAHCDYWLFSGQPGVCSGTSQEGAHYSLCGSAFPMGTKHRGQVVAVNPATCRGFNSQGVTKSLTEDQGQQRCRDEQHCAGYVLWKAPHESAGAIRLVSRISTVFPASGLEYCFRKSCFAASGQWSAFRKQGSCSATCGTGVQRLVRSCDNPPPRNGGAWCTGGDTITEPCVSGGPCPVNGGWSSWVPHGACSATCGSGTYTNVRSCTNPKPSNGGAMCPGSNSAELNCVTMVECPAPVNCQLSAWTELPPCSNTCGYGTRTRIRTEVVRALHGGVKCSGELTMTEPCNEISGCPTCMEHVPAPHSGCKCGAQNSPTLCTVNQFCYDNTCNVISDAEPPLLSEPGRFLEAVFSVGIPPGKLHAPFRNMVEQTICNVMLEKMLAAMNCVAQAFTPLIEEVPIADHVILTLGFPRNGLTEAKQTADEIKDDIAAELKVLLDVAAVGVKTEFDVKHIEADEVHFAFLVHETAESRSRPLDTLQSTLSTSLSDSLQYLTDAHTIQEVEVAPIFMELLPGIAELAVSVRFADSASLNREFATLTTRIQDVLAHAQHASVTVGDVHPYVCDDSTQVIDEEEFFFDEQRPIETSMECEYLAGELHKRFALTSTSAPSTHSHGAPRRCYMNADATSLSFTTHNQNTPGAPLCRKRVTTRCAAFATGLCRGHQSIGFDEGEWTPFVKIEASNPLFLRPANQLMANMFLQRTCKTMECQSEKDRAWCCDKKLVLDAAPRDNDAEKLVIQGMIDFGFSKKEDISKERVFENKKNDRHLDGYRVMYRGECNHTTSIVNEGSRNETSTSDSAENEDATNISIGTNVGFLGFSFESQYESAERRSVNTKNFISRAEAMNKRVVESKSECIAKDVTRTSRARPIFTQLFLSFLDKVQAAVQSNNEITQIDAFRKFVDTFGYSVIRRAEFGGKQTKLMTTTNTEHAKFLSESLNECMRRNSGTSFQIGFKVPQAPTDDEIGGGSSNADERSRCEERATTDKNDKNWEDVAIQIFKSGLCYCGVSSAGDSSQVLVNFVFLPILHFLTPGWLTQSTWFGIFNNYDAHALQQFFKKWIGVEEATENTNGATTTTCFQHDYTRYRDDPAAQASRVLCQENDSMCHLQICATNMRDTDSSRLNQHCDARSSSGCEVFCCLRRERGAECATTRATAPPHSCANDDVCVHTSGARLCTDSDTSGCRCQLATPCELTPWTDWTLCSASCDGGTQTRTRRVITPAKYGGPCEVAAATDTVTAACNPQACLKVSNLGQECLGHCQNRAGPCAWCGTGKCCRRHSTGDRRGCLAQEGGVSRHECVTGTYAKMRCDTTGAKTHGVPKPCNFPFKENGKIMHLCAPSSLGPWCATGPLLESGESNTWDRCNLDSCFSQKCDFAETQPAGMCMGLVQEGSQFSLCGRDFPLGSHWRGPVEPANPETCRSSDYNGHGVTTTLSLNEVKKRCSAEPNCAGFVDFKPQNSTPRRFRLVSRILTVWPNIYAQCFRKSCSSICGDRHDNSKCLEYGKQDADCCAGSSAACVDGYTWSRGAYGCARADLALRGVHGSCCLAPADSCGAGHVALKCMQHGHYDRHCCATSETAACQDGYKMTLGVRGCEKGADESTGTCCILPDGVCPGSHPYAYNNGESCCSYAEENGSPQSHDEHCDGSRLHMSSTCCKDDKLWTCAKPPCKNADKMHCPGTHPYAYLSGKSCCKHKKENTNSENPSRLCDGSALYIDSTCCKDDASAHCPSGSCQDTICYDDDEAFRHAPADSGNWLKWDCAKASYRDYCFHKTLNKRAMHAFCRRSCKLCECRDLTVNNGMKWKNRHGKYCDQLTNEDCGIPGVHRPPESFQDGLWAHQACCRCIFRGSAK